MVLKFQKYQTMDTMAQCASNKPPTSCLRPQTDVYPRLPTAGRNQTLEGFSELPYCAAGPTAGDSFRLPWGTSCSDKYFTNEHDAIAGCASRTKNPLLGHIHDCKWRGLPRRTRDGLKWYCADGQECRDVKKK